MTTKPKPIKLYLEQLRMEEHDYEGMETQLRESVNEETVKSYAASWGNGAEFPAIRVVCDGNDKYYIVDGWHRSLALEIHNNDKKKSLSIKAIIMPALEGKTGHESAIRYALKANMTHGERLTAGDQSNRANVALLLPEFIKASLRNVEEATGISKSTLGRVRNNLIREGALPHPISKLIGDSYLPWAYARTSSMKSDMEVMGGHNNVKDTYLEIREYIKQLRAFDKKAWAVTEEGLIQHYGIIEGQAILFSLDNNPVVKGKPKSYEIDPDFADKEHSREARKLAQEAKVKFNGIAYSLKKTGKADIVQAVETLLKHQDKPEVWQKVRQLVDAGGPLEELAAHYEDKMFDDDVYF